MRTGKPTTLSALVAFAWLVMAFFASDLLFTFASTLVGLPPYHWFRLYGGDFIWIPYLWIAALKWRPTETRSARMGVIRFSRWILWFAAFSGIVDLAWSRAWGEPSGFLQSTSWRFVGYWLVSGVWLLLLRSGEISAWVQAGAVTDGETKAGSSE